MNGTADAAAGAAANVGQCHALDAFRAAVRRAGTSPAGRYFDGCLTYLDLDSASNALAAMLDARGVGPGDRVVLYLQNMPGFVIGLLAAWKLGAIPVPANPMYRRRELALLFADCCPAALIS